MRALKALFISSRPVSWVNTAYPFALAYFLGSGSGLSLLDPTLIFGTLFFLVPYNLLMYGINDVFDYESDLINPRKGGVEGALLKPELHRLTITAAVLTSAPFAVYLYLVGTLESGIWLTLTLFTVIAYSAPGLRFKERPFLDSLTSASHFFGPMLVGLSLAGVNLLSPAIWPLVVAFALWGVASHAFGAVQDIAADRAANIGSIATAIGAKLTVRFAFLSYALAGILIATAPWQIELRLASLAVLPYLLIVSPYLSLEDENCELANRGWKRFMLLNYTAGAIVTLLVIAAFD